MRIGIALGSNLGDRLGNLRKARTRLETLHQGEKGLFLCAPVYESQPVDCPPGSPGFLNTTVELESDLAPLEILEHTQSFERELGRPDRRGKNTPRPIDIDILYTGSLVVETPRLTIPHPRITLRGFVLSPLSRIRPDLVIPGQKETVSNLLKRITADISKSVLRFENW